MTDVSRKRGFTGAGTHGGGMGTPGGGMRGATPDMASGPFFCDILVSTIFYPVLKCPPFIQIWRKVILD